MEHSTPEKYNPTRPNARLFALAGLFGGAALAFCQWLIFVYAPTEADLGLSQKIFYMHLPLAWWGLFSFFVTAVASIAYLVSGKPRFDLLAGASAEIGLLLATLALVTGSFWAKAAWNTWWTWDARLSTTLIMCFVYAGYLMVRQMDWPYTKRAKISAVLGIVAFLDVPLVYFSARLWSYIHPKTISMEPEMLHTLLACIGTFAFVWASLLALRYSLSLAENHMDYLRTKRILDSAEQ